MSRLNLWGKFHNVYKPPQITILGINYSPEQTGAAPYTTGLAKGLVSSGFDISVVTSLPHYPAWKVAKSDKSLLGSRIEHKVRVTRVRHFIPRHPSFFLRLVSELSFGLSSTFRAWNNPKVLILISPGLFSSAISLIRAKLSLKKYKIIFWVQDLYGTGLSQLKGRSFVSRLLSVVENRILDCSDHIVVPHELFTSSLRKNRNSPPITVVKNWSHLNEGEKQDPNFVFGMEIPSEKSFIILHTGNMGEKQGLSNVVAAAQLAENRKLPFFSF